MGTPGCDAQPALCGWLLRGYRSYLARSIVISGHFGGDLPTFAGSGQENLADEIIQYKLLIFNRICRRPNREMAANERLIKSTGSAMEAGLPFWLTRVVTAWVAQKHPPVLVISVEPGAGKPGASVAIRVSSNSIEAEDAHEKHSHKGSGQKKGLPPGLKSNTLHMRLSAPKTADVRCILAGISAQRPGSRADSESKVMPRIGE